MLVEQQLQQQLHLLEMKLEAQAQAHAQELADAAASQKTAAEAAADEHKQTALLERQLQQLVQSEGKLKQDLVLSQQVKVRESSCNSPI